MKRILFYIGLVLVCITISAQAFFMGPGYGDGFTGPVFSGGGGGPLTGDGLLLEAADYLLIETGDYLLLE